MHFDLVDNNLTIYLKGRIDSQTSLTIESEINELVKDKTFSYLILNFENVEFLSSAGLRIILRLKKKYNNLKVVDVVPDIYEIFEMTGFNEMMEIKRGFRKLSVEGVEEIGRGANGIVYRYADDMIVKVYFNHADLDDIKNEVRLAKKAFVSGVSTAIPFDIVKVGEYYGSVFEMIKAESLSKLINTHPEKIDEYLKEMIVLLKTLNSNVINDDSLPTIKDKAIKWIDLIKDQINEQQLNRVRYLFDTIPEDNNMVHRDFHIKNLLMQQDELILIDMDTLSKGSVIFELVGLYNAYRGFTEVRREDEPCFLGIDDETSFYVWDKVLELYFENKTKEQLKEIENKVALVSAVQLLKIHLKTGPSARPYSKEKALYFRDKLISLLDVVNNLKI